MNEWACTDGTNQRARRSLMNQSFSLAFSRVMQRDVQQAGKSQ